MVKGQDVKPIQYVQFKPVVSQQVKFNLPSPKNMNSNQSQKQGKKLTYTERFGTKNVCGNENSGSSHTAGELKSKIKQTQ